MKVESTQGEQPLSIDGAVRVHATPSNPIRRFTGTLEFGWRKDGPEPSDFVRWCQAALDGVTVDAIDPHLGPLHVMVERWEKSFDGQRGFEGKVFIAGLREL